jgi:hypothetical protein
MSNLKLKSTSNMSSNNNSGGIGFVGLLTTLFIGLKLTGVISWSWLWVLSPIWISISLTLAIVLAILAFGMIVAYICK